MKVLVTGANGQLGSEIRRMTENSPDEFTFIDIGDLDLTDLPATLRYLEEENPSCIINCAAYTAVDKAEQERDTALQLNAGLPGFLADFCKRNNAFLVQISTDYVFDGKGYKPYEEDHPADPQGHYAHTKAEGEKKILASPPSGVIIRTSWLYSEYGNNFVKTIYNKARSTDQLRVVCDQVGTPTYARDLAGVIMTILRMRDTFQGITIFHYSNEGAISWYDFAQAIVEISGIHNCKISPIETKDYPTPAKRPFYSVLNKSKIKSSLGIAIPYWRDSLAECLGRITNPGSHQNQ